MARLNESAALGESIETLKRRFVRQNREIARVNSIQSLRIRSLESEVSHLLSENVSLREQVITLGQELERFEAAKLLSDGVHGIRTKLEIKLVELNTLVSDLGTLPRNFHKSLNQTEEAPRKRLDTDCLEIKTQAAGVESNSGINDGRLPVILEDKHYPRRTLDLSEICELEKHEDIIRSTDAGVGDESEPSPKQENVSVESHRNQIGISVQRDRCETSEALLPATLETRKKKRPSASFSKKEASNASNDVGALKGTELAPTPGIKRKFSSDDDHDALETITADDDDFLFTRPSYSSQDMTGNTELTGKPAQMERGTDLKVKQKPQGLKRKALGPKSANTRISSPAGTRKSMSSEHYKTTSANANSRNDMTREPNPNIASEEHTWLSKSLGDKLVSETSEKAMHVVSTVKGSDDSLMDTHQPNTASNDQQDPVPRPTRRQRAVVSYAEPNLRDKMRRPTNEFIAAVANDDARRKSSSLPARANPDDEPNSQRGNYKDSERRSQEPVSTLLESKTPQFESSGGRSKKGMAMVSQRKRKTLSKKDDLQSPTLAEKHEDEVSCLGLLDSKPSDRSNGPEQVQGALASSVSKQNYNSEGSPVDIPGPGPALNGKHRRHSSNPRTSGQCIGLSDADAQYIPTTDCLEDITHEISIQSNEEKTDTDGGIYIESDTSLSADQRQARRGQRAAARRRSMML